MASVDATPQVLGREVEIHYPAVSAEVFNRIDDDRLREELGRLDPVQAVKVARMLLTEYLAEDSLNHGRLGEVMEGLLASVNRTEVVRAELPVVDAIVKKVRDALLLNERVAIMTVAPEIFGLSVEGRNRVYRCLRRCGDRLTVSVSRKAGLAYAVRPKDRQPVKVLDGNRVSA